MKRSKNFEHPVVKTSKFLRLTYKELGEQIGYTEYALKTSVSENKISDPMKKALELLMRAIAAESLANNKQLEQLKNNLGKAIKTLKALQEEVDILRATRIDFKVNKDELALELLNDKERYTIQIAKEIIDEQPKITQTELTIAIKLRAKSAGIDIVGDNKKWKLFDKFNGKFWRIDNSKTATKKVFYPILSENFKIAQEKKKQYLQKLADLKAGGRLPISLSKFGNYIWPHLNAKEVEKLLIDDIVLDNKGQNIVDIITKD